MSSFLNFPKKTFDSYPRYKVNPTYIKRREVAMGLEKLNPSLDYIYSQSTFRGAPPNRNQCDAKIDYSAGCPASLQVPEHLMNDTPTRYRKAVKVPIIGTQGEISGYHTVYARTNV